MKENKLLDLSFEFAKKIIFLVRSLKEEKETIISYQLGKSGTSIGANINEAQYAQSKADFVSKLQIALKEANETSYWLKLLFETGYIEENVFKELNEACSRIRVMLISSCKTAKNNMSNDIL